MSCCNCCGHSSSLSPHSSLHHPCLPLPSSCHPGCGLSLTAVNYRLTRPRCALHDCLAPRSGYAEWGRYGESWRERWLGRTEKDRRVEGGGGGGSKEEGRERDRKDRGVREREKQRSRTEGMNRRREREKRVRMGGRWIQGGGQHSGLESTD